MSSTNVSRSGALPWACLPLFAMLGAGQAQGSAAFNYSPIADPILNATFTVDFAALTAHRFVGAVEVNKAVLLDPTATFLNADLSDDLFGLSVWPGAATVDQGDFDTGFISASIPASFFPVLQTGEVGLASLFTDTDDAAFAMDTIFLTIETTTGTIVAEYGSANDGFGIGLADGNVLPAPLPESIPVDATGTGFDETITSKSIYAIPEPAISVLLAAGALLAFRRRRSLTGLTRHGTRVIALLACGLATTSALALNAAWDQPSANQQTSAVANVSPALTQSETGGAPPAEPIGGPPGPGEPDQLHVTGPLPNELVVGTEGELVVSVQSGFVGVPGVDLVYTNLMGDFTFLGDGPGPGGGVFNDTTDANGLSFMTIQADGEGPALIEISIPGSPLSPVYSLFTIVSDCVPNCDGETCEVDDGCGGECVCANPNDICFGGMCFRPGAAGPADFDADGDIDLRDFSLLARCFDPAAEFPAPGCQAADVNGDNQVDLMDFQEMEEAMTGPQ